MVYDSQYTKDMCTASKPPTQGRQIKNATAIATCRRLLQATADRRFIVRWVKVKGHSGDDGNDAADQRATWAQNGGAKNERDISSIMAYLREHG